MLLEQRVGVLAEALEMKDAQLGEVLAAAHLDPATLQQVSERPSWAQTSASSSNILAPAGAPGLKFRPQGLPAGAQRCSGDTPHCCLHTPPYTHCVLLQVNKKLEEVLTSKNSIIRALQYDVAKVTVSGFLHLTPCTGACMRLSCLRCA